MIASSELEIHADDHFVEEECYRDCEITQQIAFDSASPPRISFLEDPQTSSSGQNGVNIEFKRRKSDEKYTALALSQKKETYCEIPGGLMTSLKKCLELDSENSVSILSGNVDHFQTSKWEDIGWGCGWRNIQMLISHLLSQRQEANKILFGGSAFVPDIASLQKWLEFAWEEGFDLPGSDDFDHKIFGKRNWIGTTECATLFHSFGLRARIVDFCSKDLMKNSKAKGPRTNFCHRVK